MTSRRPPAVFYPLQRSRALGGFLVVVLAVGAAGLLGWLVQAGGTASAWSILGAGCLWAVAAASAFHGWFYQQLGAIRWDGAGWTLEASPPGQHRMAWVEPPEVVLDLQSHLWLRVVPVGQRRIWLWLERSAQPDRWLDVRRAVYSRARPGADNADATAPASSRGRES